jgi:hypothetical protein
MSVDHTRATALSGAVSRPPNPGSKQTGVQVGPV